MILHKVKVYPSKIHLAKKNQLAWKIAEIASDNAKLNTEAIEMVINRIIDNASVAIASLNRKPVISSREMALKHSRKNAISMIKTITKNPLEIVQVYAAEQEMGGIEKDLKLNADKHCKTFNKTADFKSKEFILRGQTSIIVYSCK